jgi:hypothetical protein
VIKKNAVRVPPLLDFERRPARVSEDPKLKKTSKQGFLKWVAAVEFRPILDQMPDLGPWF